MPALRWNRGSEKAVAEPPRDLSPPYGLAASRSVCPHWVGTDRLGDATCTRNEPPVSVHQAFQSVNCRSSRHERCPVFLGTVERPLESEGAGRLAARLPLLKRIALPGALGLALVIAGVIVVVGVVGFGGSGTTAATSASAAAQAITETPPESALADSAPADEAPPNEGSEAEGADADISDAPAAAVTVITASSPPSDEEPAPALTDELDPEVSSGESLENETSEATVADVVVDEVEDEALVDLPPDLEPASGAWSVTTSSGRGVAHRSDCVLSARLVTGWQDSQAVELLGVGVGRCAGWSYAEGAGVAAWVQSGWLVPAS